MPSPHDTDKLTDYLFGDLKADEEAELEKHLKTCTPCSDFVAAARVFHDALRQARKESRLPEGEVCPDTSLIVALTEGTLDEPTAQHVRAHVLNCKDCIEEFLTLERMKPRKINVKVRVAAGIVDCIDPPEDVERELLSTPPYIITRAGRQIVILGAPLRLSDQFIDSQGTAAKLTLQIMATVTSVGELPPEERIVLLFLESNPAVDWVARLKDASGHIVIEKMVEHPDYEFASISYGRYELEVHAQEIPIGRFDFDVDAFSLEDYKKQIERHIEWRHYDRALRLLDSATMTHRENRDLIELAGRLLVALTDETNSLEGSTDPEHILRTLRQLGDQLRDAEQLCREVGLDELITRLLRNERIGQIRPGTRARLDTKNSAE